MQSVTRTALPLPLLAATIFGLLAATAMLAATTSNPFIKRNRPPDRRVLERFADIALEGGISVSLRDSPGRVVEAFPFFMELDLLEIRLNELADVVDYHILCESAWTQRGDSKRFFFNESKGEARFAPFLHKIIHVMVHDKPMEGTIEADHGFNTTKWANEFYVRDQGLARGLAQLPTSFAPMTAADMLLINDVDEIPRKETVQFLRDYEGYPRFTSWAFRWSFFGFFWKMAKRGWGATSHAVPLQWAVSSGLSATAIRLERYGQHADKWMIGLPTSDPDKSEEMIAAGKGEYGGWHCQYCFPSQFYAVKATAVIESTRWSIDTSMPSPDPNKASASASEGAGGPRAEESKKWFGRYMQEARRLLREGVHPKSFHEHDPVFAIPEHGYRELVNPALVPSASYAPSHVSTSARLRYLWSREAALAKPVPASPSALSDADWAAIGSQLGSPRAKSEL